MKSRACSMDSSSGNMSAEIDELRRRLAMIEAVVAACIPDALAILIELEARHPYREPSPRKIRREKGQ